jgi:hypothetical protein
VRDLVVVARAGGCGDEVQAWSGHQVIPPDPPRAAAWVRAREYRGAPQR